MALRSHMASTSRYLPFRLPELTFGRGTKKTDKELENLQDTFIDSLDRVLSILHVAVFSGFIFTFCTVEINQVYSIQVTFNFLVFSSHLTRVNL